MKKTLENLTKAFIGESQARNRYNIYAKIAKKEGYEQIAEIFEQTADQEREHAKWLMRMINNIKEDSNPIIVEVESPNIIGSTIENLENAIQGEKHEQTEMYPEFVKIAEQENLLEISVRLNSIAKAEKHHQKRYEKLLQTIKEKTIFQKSEKNFWICRKCGYEHQGNSALKKCPSCDHPQSYFQIKCEDY